MDIFELLNNQRAKSVSANCSRVVKDLHRHLDTKTAKIKELEAIIDTLKTLSFETIEQEIGYLEKRKIDLLNELEITNNTLLDRRERLGSAQDNITTILNNRIYKRSEDDMLYTSYSSGINSTTNSSSGDRGVELILNSITNTPHKAESSSRAVSPVSSGKSEEITPSTSTLVQKLSAEEQRARALEDDYIEEKSLLDSMRELEPALVFMIHRDDISDTIIYRQPRQESEIIGMAKVVTSNTFMYSSTYLGELSDAEFSHSYGPKIVPNHDREYPNIKELAVPHNNAIFSEAPALPAGRIGFLCGAFELPITPNVIIDIWRDAATGRFWATTSISSHSFVVLERVFVTTETNWMGSTTVTQVDLFGRHPVKNYLVVESITAADE